MTSSAAAAESPLVSVMVPMYNHAKYIEECLGSIRDEDWPRIELLLLDDGSRDDTFALAQAWSAKNGARFVRIWLEKQTNQGICRTLNRLVEAAQGDYLAIIASDDTLIRGGIRSRLAHLQRHPEHLAVFGRVKLIGDDLRTISRIGKTHETHIKAWRQPGLLVRSLLLNWGLAGPILMCRRQTFDPLHGVGQYDGTLAYEDLDMYLRLLSRNALGFVNEPVGEYRVHAENFCRNKNCPPPRDESSRVWAKHKGRFRGFNRWVVAFQTWKSERGLPDRPALRSWFGRQGISIWRKCHRFNVAMHSLFY